TGSTNPTPATNPMTIAPTGETPAVPAVIPTRPARAWVSVRDASIRLDLIREYTALDTTPLCAESVVVVTMSGSNTGSASNVLPPLNPNQPNQSSRTPSAPNGILCPGMTLTLSPSYLPMRPPRNLTATSAPRAPVICTTVEPAKSVNPSLASHPSLQTQ